MRSDWRPGPRSLPLADDVIASCSAREAWDMVINIGGPNPILNLQYIGVLPSIQQLFVPSLPDAGVAGPVLDPPVVAGQQLSLAWRAPPMGAAADYVVTAAVVADGLPLAHAYLGGATTLAADVPDGPYFLRVAVRVNGVYVRSNEVFAYVGPGVVPSAPLSPAVVLNGDIATITWQPPSNLGTAAVLGYVIEAGLAPGTTALSIPRGPSVAYVTPPIPAGSYFVRVRARNVAGLGPPSSELHLVIGASPPSAPGLTGSVMFGAVTLTWQPPATGAPVTGYRLLAGLQPGRQDIAMLDLPSASTSFFVGGVASGTYYVRVVAASTAGFGDVSNEVTIVVP